MPATWWARSPARWMRLLTAEVGEPKAEVLQYGPAAENGVLFSSLVSMANRNNGRTGMGLVMASKNLKAIVVRGRNKLESGRSQARWQR